MSYRRGFSLIELLIALAVLSVAAAIIVPKFVGIRQQATDTVAKANRVILQTAFNQWREMGGTIYRTQVNGQGTRFTLATAFLMLMTSPNNVNYIETALPIAAKDSKMSAGIRLVNISIYQAWGNSWPYARYLKQGPAPVSRRDASPPGLFWTDGDIIFSYRGDGTHDIYTLDTGPEGSPSASGIWHGQPIPPLSSLKVYSRHVKTNSIDFWNPVLPE